MRLQTDGIFFVKSAAEISKPNASVCTINILANTHEHGQATNTGIIYLRISDTRSLYMSETRRYILVAFQAKTSKSLRILLANHTIVMVLDENIDKIANLNLKLFHSHA